MELEKENFERAIAFTLKWEGGFSNKKSDKGGKTNFGISKKANPSVNVTSLTLEQAKKIYEVKYWRTPKISELPWPLCLAVFDFGVHSGPETAIKSLQRVLGLVTDGIINQKTLGAVVTPYTTAKALTQRRERFCKAIVEHDPGQSVNLKGWLNRCAALMSELEK